MSRFRVVYSRGSFGLVSLCDTHDQALAKAQALHRTSGVWHVHVEDADGTRIVSAYEFRNTGFSCRHPNSPPPAA